MFNNIIYIIIHSLHKLPGLQSVPGSFDIADHVRYIP